jgi:hypothetical protein
MLAGYILAGCDREGFAMSGEQLLLPLEIPVALLVPRTQPRPTLLRLALLYS